MARLHHYTGVDVELPLGGERVYGRPDTNLELDKVSRQQFRLACTAQGLLLTSLGAHPTKVWLGGHSRTRAVLLQKGETRLLSQGDRVLLLGCDPSMFVEVKAAPAPAAAGTAAADNAAAAAATGEASARQGGSEPPSKRARTEGAAAAPGSAQQQQGRQPGGSTAAAAAAGSPVMLVLVGAQGAGKSTFCKELQRKTERPGGHRRWARVNQDTIANGRPGKREQCVEAAQQALDQGESVLIDRTNVTPEQRRPFLAVAREKGVPAHCLMLKLSRKVCGQRAAARDGHEGGLQGHSTAVFQAVNRMWSMMEEAGDPQEREGFESVIICENDKEVAAALDAWIAFGPAHPDPVAEYERRRPPLPKVNTLFNYFNKPAAGSGGGGGGVQAAGGGSSRQPADGSGGAASAAGSAGAAPQQQQQQQQQQHHQQQQQQQQQRRRPAVASGTGSGGAHNGGSTGGEGSKAAAPQVDAFQLLMHPPKPAAAAGTGQHADGGSSAAAAAAGAAGAGGAAAAGGSGSRKSRHTWTAVGPFASSLVNIAANPESCRREQPQLWFDDRCVWIADKFAKAREHWLVVAREPRLEGPLDLTAADIPLVEHMLGVARERTQAMQQQQPDLQFRYGFHSVPSLRQLHMHVVSQDFNSSWLKNKKHWNSFTSPFFLDAEWVLGQLRQAGRLDYSLPAKEALLKGDLRCHRCGAAQPNMPWLKEHIGACREAVRLPQH